ncbi:hypothetical protein HNQ02_003297 [Flavobacterium sp. 7E]|uniref:hypothetical protein n=1 Tax=Flavobacterium sp. 7E TaxID=2735898 RepID=UPI00156EB376|nr:hypothetical protein [Flavobacterium sp. 7E]NRS90357.1 hypothetical protein [Flavobacterium sp. 7E]
MGVRKNILNSQYEIIAHYSDYQVIEIYLFLEWVVVEKESTIFFNPRSKLGILHSFEFEAKLVDETKKMVIVAIKTNRNGKIIDTLKKQKILITY